MKFVLNCVFVFQCLTYSATSQPLPGQSKALGGLSDIYVSSLLEADEDIYLEATSEGWLKTKVELACRTAGITVIDTIQHPIILISLKIMQLDSHGSYVDYYFYNVSIRVIDAVFIGESLNKGMTFSAYTWSQAFIGGTPKKDFQDVIARGVNNLIDLFINDYLAANQAEEKMPSIYDVIDKDGG